MQRSCPRPPGRPSFPGAPARSPTWLTARPNPLARIPAGCLIVALLLNFLRQALYQHTQEYFTLMGVSWSAELVAAIGAPVNDANVDRLATRYRAAMYSRMMISAFRLHPQMMR